MYLHEIMTESKRKQSRTLVSDARDVVERCAGTNIRLAARRITNFLETEMRATGLSIAQFGLMAHVAAAEDDTISGLAERTGLDQSTLSRNLRALEGAGLVEIAVVERDLRKRAVWLTETGARRLAAAIPVWQRAQETLSAFLDPTAVQQLAAATAGLDGTDQRPTAQRSSLP